MTALRIPLFLVAPTTALGVTGLTFSDAEVRVSQDGGHVFANGTGTVHEIGSGAYYYEVGTGEGATAGALVVLIEKAGAVPYSIEERIPIVGDFVQSEATAAKRRTAVYLFTAAGAAVTGLAGWAGSEIQISKNGGAWTDFAGTMTEGEQGVYSYEAGAAELNTIGLWMIKINKGTARVVVAAANVAKSGTLTMSNLTPAPGTTPGTGGQFSATFRTARLTPIEFDLAGLTTGEQVTISVGYADRNEVYVARDAEGIKGWPFDTDDNTIGDQTVEPCHVKLLPRGGWPPCDVEIKVASAMMAAT